MLPNLKKTLCLTLVLGFFIPLQAQFEGESEENETHIDKKGKKLGNDLLYGNFEFHMRTIYMATINQGSLLDYSALGSGAGLGYYSPSYKGFHVGFSGFFVFQLHQSNIYKADPKTGGVNRYEILLFDMNDLENRADLDRLEELYLTYEKKNLKIELGRQKFHSPLLNEQDNRMRGNIFSGLSARYHYKEFHFTGAFFNAMTIRGTVDWYSVHESFGVYPFGRNPLGVDANYKENTHSDGIGIIGIKHHRGNVKSQLWNYTADQVFNLSFWQSDWEKQGQFFHYKTGFQGFYQTALGEGGNPNPEKAFILPNEQTYALGGMAGFGKKKNLLSINYLGISKQGRFLFPREWGREAFYVTLPRERFEGVGGAQIFTLKYHQHLNKKENFTADLGLSQVNLSELNDIRHNKYGLPSYYHFSALLDYRFKGYWEGLDLKLLAVYKRAQDQNIPDIFRLNRVDLWHFNLIVDYRF